MTQRPDSRHGFKALRSQQQANWWGIQHHFKQTLSMFSRGKSSWTFSGVMKYWGVTCQCVRVIWYLISSTRAAVEAMRTLPGWWKPMACRRYEQNVLRKNFSNEDENVHWPVQFPPPGSRTAWCCHSGPSWGWCPDGNTSSDPPVIESEDCETLKANSSQWQYKWRLWLDFGKVYIQMWIYLRPD